MTSTDPRELFQAWWAEAEAAEPRVPDAMQLATVDTEGRPSLRTVLLKELRPSGELVFFTNYESRKARDLDTSGQAAILLHWKSLERQIVAEGPVRRASAEASDAYWATRPRGSQLGGWASRQGRAMAGREQLLGALEEVAQHFEGSEVPRPPHWGGYVLTPRRWEFWQGRADRLHERRELTLGPDGWVERLLQP